MAAELPPVGTAVNYLSQSRNVWVASKVYQINEKRKTIMVTCKPGCWIFWPSEIVEYASEVCEYAVDDDVEYLSSSAKRWLFAKVVAVEGSRIQIDIKPRYWFTSTDQGACIRLKKTRRKSKTEREDLANNLRLLLLNKNTLRQLADKTFRDCDLNQSHFIEMDEMRMVISTLATSLQIEELNDAQLEANFKRFDLEGRGHLGNDEFCEFLESLLQMTLRKYQKVHRMDFIEEKRNFENDYKKLKKIGHGSFGEVYLVQPAGGGGTRVAKSIDKVNCKMSLRQMEVEIETLKMLDHPHLVKLFGWYPTAKVLYIVMDYAEGGELLQLVNRVYKKKETLSERWVATVIEQTLDAIGYIHSKRLVHRDIKLENIMLLNEVKSFDLSKEIPHALVIDLGIAEIVTSGRLKNLAGTPTTMAPEIWRGDYGPKSDIFSVGCVLFTMLSGTYPFLPKKVTREPHVWIQLIQTGPRYSAIKASSQGVAFVKQLLTFSEHKRPTATQAKKDPWFNITECAQMIELNPEKVEALLRFREESDIKRGVLLQAVSQLSVSAIPELTGLFKMVSDGGSEKTSNCITVKDATVWLMSFKVNEHLAKETAQALDLDHSGEIEFSEFLVGCMALFDNKIGLILKTAFRTIDTDNSGEISSEELSNLLRKIGGEGITSRETEDAILRQIDRDGDGIITYDEFRVFFTPEVFKVQFDYNDHTILYIKTDQGMEYRKDFVLKRICKCIKIDEHGFVWDCPTSSHGWNGEKHKLPDGSRQKLINDFRVLCQVANVEFIQDQLLQPSSPVDLASSKFRPTIRSDAFLSSANPTTLTASQGGSTTLNVDFRRSTQRK
eukprot:GEMP01005381.1.p1 GENE.GEMP01005381.1~~GEMP01005381.1.p1  ORF type:complete len:836 (+),score=228.65 GEMP01005381.1:224-2731(+)